MRYLRTLMAFFSTPWAISPDKYEIIRAILVERAAGGRRNDEQVAAAMETRRPEQYRQEGRIAVIPVIGVLSQRVGAMEEASGGISTEAIRKQIDAALADKAIGKIVLQIDSPGGSVAGVPELAAKVRKANDVKKVIAIADSYAASAAYWIGSQAAEFYATPSAMVGSIGVISEYVDVSKAKEAAGLKSTVIAAGKYKGENRGEPLTEEGAAKILADVNHFYGMFVADVAKGRRVTEATVRNGYGEGRSVVAEDAKAQGMIDGIVTFERLLARLGASASATAAAARARALEIDD